MGKKTLATVIMLIGIILFVLELTIIELDGVGGFILSLGAVLMAIGGAVTLCILNKQRNGEVAIDTAEAGFSMIALLLEIFFDI